MTLPGPKPEKRKVMARMVMTPSGQEPFRKTRITTSSLALFLKLQMPLMETPPARTLVVSNLQHLNSHRHLRILILRGGAKGT